MKKCFLNQRFDLGGSTSTTAGVILINVLIFGFIAMLITTALANWAATLYKTTQQLAKSEQAFQLAESGIEYYRWHLNYNATDYKDGSTTNSTGPFIHTFTDADGNVIGTFALTITPPPVGSTIVVVKSTGTIASTTITRTIQASLAIPSLAKFAVVANDVMNFGVGTEVFGPIQSNNGIHFDGLAHNLVSSAMATYTDPDSNTKQWAVWTDVGTDDPAPPTPLPTRTDVFAAGRQVAVPGFDFTSLTANMSQLASSSQSGGFTLQSSGVSGYHIVFSVANGTTTFNVYKVTAVKTTGNGGTSNCSSDSQNAVTDATWNTATISTQSNAVSTNNHIPSNGIIFVYDNVWVDGTISNARVTIAAGVFPSSNKNISINVTSNLLYTYKTGSDSIALIAQNNVNVGLDSPDTLEIDGALVAQSGRVGRYYYAPSCGSDYAQTSLTLYGMIASYVRYGFAWSGNNNYNCGGSIGYTASGYCTRNINYDANMLYAPPPSFPLSSSQYSIIQWGEVSQ